MLKKKHTNFKKMILISQSNQWKTINGASQVLCVFWGKSCEKGQYESCVTNGSVVSILRTEVGQMTCIDMHCVIIALNNYQPLPNRLLPQRVVT